MLPEYVLGDMEMDDVSFPCPSAPLLSRRYAILRFAFQLRKKPSELLVLRVEVRLKGLVI